MHDWDEHHWEPANDHRIEEGGWQKRVSPPKAESRPPGLPPTSSPPAASNPDSKEKNSDG